MSIQDDVGRLLTEVRRLESQNIGASAQFADAPEADRRQLQILREQYAIIAKRLAQLLDDLDSTA